MKRMQGPLGADTALSMAAFVEDTLDNAATPLGIVTKVNIVVDEVLHNILSYSGAHVLSVAVEVQNGEVHLEFQDDGCPYDPTMQPEPDMTLSAEERQIGGLGVLLVKKSMDRVLYERDGERNVLHVYKACKA